MPATMRQVGTECAAAAEPDLHLARADGAHRHVEGEHQHVHARGLRTLDQIKADGVVVLGEAIELEPEHVGRDRGDLLDGGAAGAAERIGHADPLGCGREQLVGAGPHHDRAAHRGDADRRGEFAPEQFDANRRQFGHHAIARHHLDGVERVPIASDAGVFAGAAIAIFEREMRQPRARAVAQVVDRRIPALMLEEIRAPVMPGDGRHPRRHVVHCNPHPDRLAL